MQMASVVAAGAKGIMLFQSDLTLEGSSAWKNGGKMMKMIAGIGDAHLRSADFAGPGAFTKDDDDDASLVGVLYGPVSLTVVAISTNADSYSDVTCSVGVSNHWQFHSHTIKNLEVKLPSDWKDLSLSVQEVNHDGQLDDLQDGATAKVDDSSITIADIDFDDGPHVLARMFVITKA